jgi:hypothetical protein
MATGILSPTPILQFFLNNGAPAVGGSILTQVGGVNAATYSNSSLTTALPNPIPLNSRGEVSTSAGASSPLFLTPNVVYSFTLFDSLSNQIWTQPYVNEAQFSLTPTIVGQALWPQTTAELAASITPLAYNYAPGDLRRYGAVAAGNVTTALANSVAQAQQADGAAVYIPSALGTASTITAGVTISTPIMIYGDGFSSSVLTATADITVFTLTNNTNPGCTFKDFQLIGIGNQTSIITGYIVGTALTVSSVVGGAVATGQTIRGVGTTNGSTAGTSIFGLNLVSGGGSSWVVNTTGNVYSSATPGTFYLGPANPAIVLTSSTYNQFQRLKISGFGYGVELQTGGNASFLNSFDHCVIISNAMANLYLQSQSHQTILNGCTIGGGFVGWGAYVTDSSGFSVFGGDCEGTAQVGIELDNVAATGNGAHFISGIDFEGNRDVGGNIRIGNTNVVNGVTIASCTMSYGGAGDNYAINPQNCYGLKVLSCNFPSGYGTSILNLTATITNASVEACKGLASASYFESGVPGIGYQTGVGVGGAITQLTSRTTGVTLNTPTGAVTMFSAAGSPTPASFTVTNSAVAATDTVLVTQKSGTTNIYTFDVAQTAVGSFQIVFYTTGGTAIDAPVINFNVIKGAVS